MKCRFVLISVVAGVAWLSSSIVYGQGNTVERDNFDSYANGTVLNGVGGWTGWDNTPAAAGTVDNAQSRSGPNSVRIDGPLLTDAVQEYDLGAGGPPYSGVYTYCADVYMPAGGGGDPFFILLNTYVVAPGTKFWSLQFSMDYGTGVVSDQGSAPLGGNGGAAQPLVVDQWVPIDVCIDLTNDLHTVHYNGGAVIIDKSWTDGVSQDGALDIDAVDLWSDDLFITPIYYDNVRLVKGKKHKVNAGVLVEGFGQQNDFNAVNGFDDVRWAAHGASLFFQISDPVSQFQLSTTTTDLSPTTIQVDVEASKQTAAANLNVRAQLFNFNTGLFQAMSGGVMVLATTDAIKTFSLPAGGTPSHFVNQSTGEVRVLLQSIQTSGPPNVRTQIDDLWFNIN